MKADRVMEILKTKEVAMIRVSICAQLIEITDYKITEDGILIHGELINPYDFHDDEITVDEYDDNCIIIDNMFIDYFDKEENKCW